jgi:hypothetical protein
MNVFMEVTEFGPKKEIITFCIVNPLHKVNTKDISGAGKLK